MCLFLTWPLPQGQEVRVYKNHQMRRNLKIFSIKWLHLSRMMTPLLHLIQCLLLLPLLPLHPLLTTGVERVQIQWFLDPPLLMALLLSLLIMFELMIMSLITISLYKDPVMEILSLCLDSPKVLTLI